jgi:hypothetical protein
MNSASFLCSANSGHLYMSCHGCSSTFTCYLSITGRFRYVRSVAQPRQSLLARGRSVPEIIQAPRRMLSIVDSMAATIPYTYFQCPCTSDISTPLRKGGETVRSGEEGEVEDERNFDTRAPRSNYSLYPLEHLLYCEDCQQIRCPKCVLDETVTWYCPNCLFEVPSSTVKSEGNRYV